MRFTCFLPKIGRGVIYRAVPALTVSTQPSMRLLRRLLNADAACHPYVRYLVEARVTFEVQADSAAEAIRLVSTSDHNDEAVSVEYLVRQQDQPIALSEAK